MSNRKIEPESNLLPEPRRQTQGRSALKSGSLNYKVNRIKGLMVEAWGSRINAPSVKFKVIV